MFPLDHKPYIYSNKNSPSETHPTPSSESLNNTNSACKTLIQPRSYHNAKQNSRLPSDWRLGSPMEKMSLKSQDLLINHSKASDSFHQEEMGSPIKNLNSRSLQYALDIESSQESDPYYAGLNKNNSASIFSGASRDFTNEKNINLAENHLPMVEKSQITSLDIQVTNSSTTENLDKKKKQEKSPLLKKSAPSSSDYQHIEIPQEDESEPQISIISHQQRASHPSMRLLNQRQNRLDQSGSEENQSLQSEEAENPQEYISTESFLRITCVCLTSVLFALSYVTDIIERRQTADKLFYIAYGALAYIVGEHIYVFKALESSVWEKREALFNVLDGAAALSFAVSVQCCHFRYISRWYIIAAPALFGLFTTAYCFLSQAPKAQKDTKAILKSFYTVQTALIAAKICGYHFCDWRYILLPVGIYFGISACYGIIITFLFVSVTFVAICQWKMEILAYIGKNIVGYVWYILYHATSIVIGAILFFIFSEREIREDNEMLRTAIDIWNYLSIVMFCYTVILYPCLKGFVKSILQTFSLVDENIKADLYQGKNRIKQLKSGRKTYFMMISPTYFVSLYEGFLLKSQERVKKLRNEDKNLNTLYNLKDLKKDKEILDQKLAENSQPIHKKLVRSNSLKNISQISTKNTPKYFEAEDLQQNIQEYKEQGQNLCYICVVKEADSVIGQCGHGGVCEECVVLSIVHKNECMECRRPAKAIYKIEKTVKNSNIVQAVKKMQIV